MNTFKYTKKQILSKLEDKQIELDRDFPSAADDKYRNGRNREMDSETYEADLKQWQYARECNRAAIKKMETDIMIAYAMSMLD